MKESAAPAAPQVQTAPVITPVDLVDVAPVEAILALQRTAGNQAVTRFLGRAETAEQTKVKELDEELDSFDVDEEKVITVLNGLTDTEVQEVLSGGYSTKVADALDVEEMIRAVKKLPTLVTKLEWIKAAGTPDYDQIRPLIIDPKVSQLERDALAGWREWFVDVCDNASIKQVVTDLKLSMPAQLLFLGKEMCADYSDLKALITAPTVTDNDRIALLSTSWRTWFVDVCNNETIVEAVKDLKFGLKTKLDWMAEEGTSEEAIGEVTRNSSQGELDDVQLEPGLMESLQERLTGGEYALVERMVKQGQLGQQDITNTADIGAEFKAVLTMWRTGVVLSKEIKFIEEGTWTPAALEAMIQRCVASVDTWLSRKYKLKIASPSGPQEGDGEYPIIVKITPVASGPHEVTLHSGTGRSSMLDDDGQLWCGGQPNDPTGIMDVTLAHEFGHMVLGQSDEYADEDVPARVPSNDNSLMGHYRNEGPWPTPAGAPTPGTEIKARHFGFLVQQVGEWFPGRNISIVK